MSRRNKVMRSDVLGHYTLNKKAFDDYRNGVVEEFMSESIFYKQRITQCAYWTDLGKDLADQLLRDERWIFGVKVKDELKFIDHGVNKETNSTKKLGF